MFVKVRKAEIKTGPKKDGTSYTAVLAVVIFPDKETAEKLFIPDDVCDPLLVEPGKAFDMYRDHNGNVLVFDEYQPEGSEGK